MRWQLLLAVSNGFAFTLQHRILDHVGHALPADAVVAGDDADAHDLYQTVLQFPGVHGLIPNIRNGSNATGALVPRVGGPYSSLYRARHLCSAG